MKAFQCSKCKQLADDDIEDKVFCQCGIQPNPRYRDKSDREACLEAFIEIPQEKRWHKKCRWE